MDPLRNLVGRLVRMVGIGQIRLTKDDGEQQLHQVNINRGGPQDLEEVIDDVPRLGQYGLAYCPPDGSEAIVLFVGGRRSSGVVIATGYREERPKNLQPGEAMLFNSLADIWIKLCADGKIRSKGDWEHDGGFKATGDVLDHSATNTATMKVHRDAFNTHKHGGVTAGGAMTAITDHTAP